MLCFVVLSIAVLSFAVVGDFGGEEARRAAPSDIRSNGVLVVQQRISWWSDYVRVDAIDGSVMTVHTTRGLGHDPTPYQVQLVPETVIHPVADTSVIGSAGDVRPGAYLYFVGNTVIGGNDLIYALRVFNWNEAD